MLCFQLILPCEFVLMDLFVALNTFFSSIEGFNLKRASVLKQTANDDLMTGDSTDN